MRQFFRSLIRFILLLLLRFGLLLLEESLTFGPGDKKLFDSLKGETVLGDGIEHEAETKHDDLGDTTEITQEVKESIDSSTMCNRCLIHKHNRLIERVLKFWNRVIHGSSLDLLNDILNIIKYVTDELTKLNPVFRCLNRVYPKEGVIHLHQFWIDERLALHLHDRVGRLLVILRKNYLSLN